MVLRGVKTGTAGCDLEHTHMRDNQVLLDIQQVIDIDTSQLRALFTTGIEEL